MGNVTEITKITARSLQSSTFWVINFGAIAVCFLSGPFGTLEALPSGFRLIYWGLIVLTTSTLAMWLHALIRNLGRVSVPVIFAVSVIFGLLVAGLVLLMSLSLLQPIDRYPGHLELLSYSFPSAAMIFMLSAMVMRSSAHPISAEPVKGPILMGHLEKYPHAQKILSLSAQDHYVEVTTDLGAELCLLRLNDAILQADPIEGFQIHRSHWVAKSAIKEVIAKGAGSQVLLTDGRILSVSQSRLAAFREFLQST